MSNFKDSNQTLITLYEELLDSLKLEVRDGIIYPKDGKRSLYVGKLPLVMPTRENIGNFTEVIDGNIVKNKELFNPLKETVVGGENKTLIRFKEHLERLTSFSLTTLGETLFSVIKNSKDIEIHDMELLGFIEELNNEKGRSKVLVDDNTIKNWVKIATNLFLKDSKDLPVHMYLKKGGKIGTVSYNRICVTSYPLLEKLLKHKDNKDKTIHRVNLRTKDLTAYSLFYSLVFKDDERELTKGVQFGSKSNVSPAFMSLLVSYEYIANSINRIIDALENLDVDLPLLEIARLEPLKYKVSTYSNKIDKLKLSIDEVPMDVNDPAMKTHNINSVVEEPVVRDTMATILGYNTETPEHYGSEPKVVTKQVGVAVAPKANRVPFVEARQQPQPQYQQPQPQYQQQPNARYQTPQYQEPQYQQPQQEQRVEPSGEPMSALDKILADNQRIQQQQTYRQPQMHYPQQGQPPVINYNTPPPQYPPQYTQPQAVPMGAPQGYYPNQNNVGWEQPTVTRVSNNSWGI